MGRPGFLLPGDGAVGHIEPISILYPTHILPEERDWFAPFVFLFLLYT